MAEMKVLYLQRWHKKRWLKELVRWPSSARSRCNGHCRNQISRLLLHSTYSKAYHAMFLSYGMEKWHWKVVFLLSNDEIALADLLFRLSNLRHLGFDSRTFLERKQNGITGTECASVGHETCFRLMRHTWTTDDCATEPCKYGKLFKDKNPWNRPKWPLRWLPRTQLWHGRF